MQPAGESLVARDLSTPAHRRTTAQLLERYLRTTNGVHDPAVWAPIIAALARGAQDATDPRGAARCAGVLALLRSQDIQIVAHLDKANRLDEGDPTERVTQDVEIRVSMDQRG